MHTHTPRIQRHGVRGMWKKNRSHAGPGVGPAGLLYDGEWENVVSQSLS